MSKKQPKKPHRTERQHYVPQCYLRGFTNASGLMFCYDKANDRSHPTSTTAAAQEPYFYEISPGSLRDFSVPINTVEKALGVVEKTWVPLHAKLIKSADEGRISEALMTEYAPFLAMQWMRTRTYRDTVREVTQKSMQSLADELVEINFPGEKKPKVTVSDQQIAALHSQKIFDQEAVKRMSDDLTRHYWVVGINNTEHLFYTSDHPVVRRGNQTQQGRRLVGILDPGIEFVFPLDSRHILLILERTHFANWQKNDHRGIVLVADQVRDYNSLQVMRSSQRVFCENDDFHLAREVCVAHPEVRDPNRPRVIVEMTQIKDMKNFILVTALE
ncbi:MAG: hypothetical protein C3F12_11425 [Candidatus Methylomirabilota bacterium]|nr:DUF4238 domain-containing protein [Candidatus Methylomirabilis sp.]NJD68091.1 DUF4238 domain-containing protein [candidate division NC10 bacterium]PWB44303.1 MAG: hypothetical protein C3F12_11425 [candidate division NC10 bacterium]